MTTTTPTVKKQWKVFWDLQCPFSRKNWSKFNSIKDRFSNEYDFIVYLTSLAFHPQAFMAQSGASLIETYKGREALFKYVDTCFENQELYMNAAIEDSRKSEIIQVFAGIAEKSGVLDSDDDTESSRNNHETLLTKSTFVKEIDDWEKAIKPAYTEHKIALGYGVFGSPSHVIDEKLVPDTESDWNADDWAEKLSKLKEEKNDN